MPPSLRRAARKTRIDELAGQQTLGVVLSKRRDAAVLHADVERAGPVSDPDLAGGAGPQLSRPSVVAIGIFGPAIAGASRATSAAR